MYDFADYTKFRGSAPKPAPKKEEKPKLMEVFIKSLKDFAKGE